MKINLYDFDNTIYNGDSSLDFFLYCLIRKPIIIITLPKIVIASIKYKLGIIDKTRMKSIIFKFVKYIDVETMVDNFWLTHKKNIKQFYLEKSHDKDIIISASPEFLLKPMKEYLGVLDLISSVVDEHTGEFLKPNCHDIEKVKRLNEIYQDYEVMESYSDSMSDKPIFDLAHNSYLVKGNKIKSLK